MSRTDFSLLTVRQQREYMHNIALRALDSYQLAEPHLKLLNPGFNYTYRVDTADGTKFALRINVNSRRSRENLQAEVHWINDLGSATVAWVPLPQENRSGELITYVDPNDGAPFPAVLYSWLPGSDMGRGATPERWYVAGATMARLHQHSTDVVLPPDASLPLLKSVTWGTEDRLHPSFIAAPSGDAELLREVWEQCATVMDRVWKGQKGQPIHADLHGGNMKWYRGRLAVFDFDDSGWGLPIQDLAISSYYIRDEVECEVALHEGYQSVQPLPTVKPDDYEWLVAHRNLLLLNDLLSSVTSELRQMIPRYTETTIARIRQFLATGTYRHRIDNQPS